VQNAVTLWHIASCGVPRGRADTVGRMRVRWIGLALTLALVGAAAGYALGHAALEEPTSLSSAQPLRAVSPSYPVNEYDVRPDPGIAPLSPDLPLRPATFRTGALRMTADVPRGWRREPMENSPEWNLADADNPINTYKVRIGIDAGDRVSVTVARNARIDALKDAEANGNLEHVVVERLTDDGFTVTYIDGGYQRVAMERWLPQHDSNSAFATIAVAGREVDRQGMADLLERIAASADY
jgi:hypothetical protein